MKLSRVASTIGFMLLTACSLVQSMDSSPTPSTNRPPLPQSTPVSTRARDLHAIATPHQQPTINATIYDCHSQPDMITHYGVTAEMHYVKRELNVAQEITFSNSSDIIISTVVFNVNTNWQPGIFRLQSINLADGIPAKSHLNGQRLEITLPEPLNPHCIAHIKLNFDLHLPPIDIGGLHAYQGYLGYTGRQTNLGLWLPVIAPHTGNEWLSHEVTPIGEQDVLEVANWDINFRIVDMMNNIEIAAPGISEKISDNEWHFSLTKSRDFSFSIGENYRLLQQKTESDINVEVYSFENALVSNGNEQIDSAAFALTTAVKSINLYEKLYGPYPLKRLVIVEGDFPDGMEFSGIVFVGGEYFRALNGVQSYLTIITAHEVSHQWWYALVGNDQAINPWLDEALATYSELIFIEKYYPSLKDWWWNFRINRLTPQGFVDSTVYEFSSRRAYINAVYLRGVKMFDALRTKLGDDVFFGWLNRYVAQGSGRIMTPNQFWTLLTEQQLMQTEPIRQEYLHNPQIIMTSTSSCDFQTTCTTPTP